MTFRETIKQMLHHDLGFGFYIKEGAPEKKFKLTSKDTGMLCGTIFIRLVLDVVDEFFLPPNDPLSGYARRPSIRLTKHDGDIVSAGREFGVISGNAEVILKAERTILYFLRRLSGIATYTRKMTKLVEDMRVLLLDTRKDNPLERELDKYAVRIGRAGNHRSGIYDGILIKDNDIAVYGGVSQAVDARLITRKLLTRVEIEVGDLKTLEEVLADGRVDVIMLDNMPPSRLREAVATIKSASKQYLIEASGIGNFSIYDIAQTGVNYISLSALVTVGSGHPLDISMKVVS